MTVVFISLRLNSIIKEDSVYKYTNPTYDVALHITGDFQIE